MGVSNAGGRWRRIWSEQRERVTLRAAMEGASGGDWSEEEREREDDEEGVATVSAFAAGERRRQ